MSQAKPSQIELIKISTNIIIDKQIIHSFLRVNDQSDVAALYSFVCRD